MFKISPNFYAEEFLFPEWIQKWGVRAISYIDEELVLGSEVIRDHFGGKPMILNNWFRPGGTFKYRGLRPRVRPTDQKWAEDSFHIYGKAEDFEIVGVDSLEVQAEIKKNWPKFRPYFSTMEEGTKGWTHLDRRWIANSKASEKPFLVPIPK